MLHNGVNFQLFSNGVNEKDTDYCTEMNSLMAWKIIVEDVAVIVPDAHTSVTITEQQLPFPKRWQTGLYKLLRRKVKPKMNYSRH